MCLHISRPGKVLQFHTNQHIFRAVCDPAPTCTRLITALLKCNVIMSSVLLGMSCLRWGLLIGLRRFRGECWLQQRANSGLAWAWRRWMRTRATGLHDCRKNQIYRTLGSNARASCRSCLAQPSRPLSQHQWLIEAWSPGPVAIEGELKKLCYCCQLTLVWDLPDMLKSPSYAGHCLSTIQV